jgi:hypothetical protein
MIYKPGARNTNADALSKINITEVNTVNETSSVPTDEEKMKILQEFHQQPTGGHLGMIRTFERIKLYASWPGMKQEIENDVKHCDTCQKNKITQRKLYYPYRLRTHLK